MKALVLAGGAGTRLRPLSYSRPKQLAPVANKPVLFHCLESLRDAGITETGIIVAGSGSQIREAVGRGERFGLRITYLPQEAPLGLAHCVVVAREFLGDDDFVMHLADNMLDGGLAGHLDIFRHDRPDALLLLSRVADPAGYGIATLDESGQVTAVEEKPRHATSELALTGVYIFRPSVHEAIAGIEPSQRGELEITDAIQWLIAAGRDVRAQVHAGYWKDTGRIDDLLECNQTWLKTISARIAGQLDEESCVIGPAIIEPGARIRRSRLRGPLIVGSGSTIINSMVGPFASVGRNCLLVDTSIERSIVLDGSCIRRLSGIADSLIGQSAHVGGVTGPASHRLIIGDDCRVLVAP
jgi:glucose-1-phosphate thymidylyltransferase